jgi:hypothetical protein
MENSNRNEAAKRDSSLKKPARSSKSEHATRKLGSFLKNGGLHQSGWLDEDNLAHNHSSFLAFSGDCASIQLPEKG